ncbi:MGDG synthase family glycosyltransferase [Terrilactibacillus laevilacticus]|uniref:MGDG synthase family glycosyltransferase n=1 Tax=Terrilactibacillus laevilacticus TaxID=1380157 RepID=UPI001146C6A9|nr:glycosyltransferase [Terrilactibacillus laevilacticus]
MKILFLPLFKMPSGHHRVADALIDMMSNRCNDIQCEKVDLLSYSNKSFEKMISKLYLKWIHFIPKTYDWSYKHFAYTRTHKHCTFIGFEKYFLHHLKKLLNEEKPDLVVCTHGFPSLLMSRLKEQGIVNIPVINAYTDFFMNDIWGRQGIDFHLVPNQQVKKHMVEKYHMDEKYILVTGIPVHETFLKNGKKSYKKDPIKTILIAGGSSGLGDIVGLIKKTNPNAAFRYIILCGKNQRLFESLNKLNLPHVTALPYVQSREEMNQLYNKADAIVTKPGGVTISEALCKHIPIFVHSALPGQELINLEFLTKQNLVYKINMKESLDKQLSCLLNNEVEQIKWKKAIQRFFKDQEIPTLDMVYAILRANVMDGESINEYRSDIPVYSGVMAKLKKYVKKLPISNNV